MPFWLAGSCGTANKLEAALQLGAAGIQVGTAFAFCEESGVAAGLKRQILQLGRAHQLEVFTDPLISPTGFPFKVVQLAGTLSESGSRTQRSRRCDLGFLRHAYRRADGTFGYRCPAEPVEDFVRKGGALEETQGRECVCNGLLATIGLPQIISQNEVSLPLVTAGNEIAHIARFLRPGQDSYNAAQVVGDLLGQASAAGNSVPNVQPLQGIPVVRMA